MNFKSLFIALLTVAGLTLGVYAQQMPLNSSNPEAEAKLRQALDLMAHDMPTFGKLVMEAHELDPAMPMANFFMAVMPENPADGKPYADAFNAFEGELTEAEQQFAKVLVNLENEDLEAAPYMVALTEMYPNDAHAHLLSGFSNSMDENFEVAVAALEKAIAIKRMPGAYNMLGYTYMRMGEMEKAKSAFETYALVVPGHANPHDSMGDLLMAMEDYEAAAAEFDKAAELDPNNAYHAEKAEKAREMMNK